MWFRLTDVQRQVLMHACREFDASNARKHIKSCDPCHVAIIDSARFSAWKIAYLTDRARLNRLLG
jgi:hypothetical protein